MSSVVDQWRQEDVDSFLALDTDLKPPSDNQLLMQGLLFGQGSAEPVGGNSIDWWNQERARLIDEAWNIRDSHPVYKSLKADPSFRAAWTVFERNRKMAFRQPQSSKLTSPATPFVFLHDFVQYASYSTKFPRLSEKSNWGAYAGRRRKAARRAHELIELMDEGISLNDYFENKQLQAGLRKLTKQLLATERKDYGGARWVQRWVLKSLAYNLFMHCELQSPAVVTHFARMVGYSIETKTAQRYFREAERRRRADLAVALRSGQKITKT
jgi:hypothetical protein